MITVPAELPVTPGPGHLLAALLAVARLRMVFTIRREANGALVDSRRQLLRPLQYGADMVLALIVAEQRRLVAEIALALLTKCQPARHIHCLLVAAQQVRADVLRASRIPDQGG